MSIISMTGFGKSESTLNGTGNRRDGRRRFDRGNRGDRPQRNFNNEAKKEER